MTRRNRQSAAARAEAPREMPSRTSTPDWNPDDSLHAMRNAGFDLAESHAATKPPGHGTINWQDALADFVKAIEEDGGAKLTIAQKEAVSAGVRHYMELSGEAAPERPTWPGRSWS